MRSILILAPLLAACSQEAAQPSLATGTFAGEGRDRLCIAGDPGAYRAGLIAYGEGNANCSAAGRLEQSGATWVLVPQGEGDCRIPLEINGNIARIGRPPAACSYYLDRARPWRARPIIAPIWAPRRPISRAIRFAEIIDLYGNVR